MASNIFNKKIAGKLLTRKIGQFLCGLKEMKYQDVTANVIFSL